MTNNSDSQGMTLDGLAKGLIEKGILRPDQIKLWSFKDLYLADPATLTPSERRDQIEYHNSAEFAKFRKQHGFE